ncbi:hypothetical protein [Gryllotalpicola koreensis]
MIAVAAVAAVRVMSRMTHVLVVSHLVVIHLHVVIVPSVLVVAVR